MIKDYVMLFEEFDNTLYEDDELSGGKRAALSRGDDILTKEQYAACYVVAKNKLGRQEDTRRDGDSSMTRTAMNMSNDSSEDWKNLSGAKLSIQLGLKPQTVERNISKFVMMLNGNMEGTPSNVLYPEIKNHFEEFEGMQIAEVIAMAEEALDPNADTSMYDEYLDKTREQGKKSREKKKVETTELRRNIREIFLNLLDAIGDPIKAAKMTSARLAKEYDMDRDKIVQEAMREFKNEQTLITAWRKSKKG